MSKRDLRTAVAWTETLVDCGAVASDAAAAFVAVATAVIVVAADAVGWWRWQAYQTGMVAFLCIHVIIIYPQSVIKYFELLSANRWTYKWDRNHELKQK